MKFHVCLALCLLCLVACGDDSVADDAAVDDAGPAADGSDLDAGDAGPVSDAGPDASDADAADAGSDVGPRRSTFPSAGGIDPADLAKAAALFGACIPDDGSLSFLRGQYFDLDIMDSSLVTREAFECLAMATDGCAAVERCVGVSFDRMGPCETTCDGSVLEQCDDASRFRIDCARFGQTCDAEEGDCVDDAAPTCEMNASAMCLDGVPTGCSDHRVREGFDCAEYGLTCTGSICIGEGTCDTDRTGTYGLSYTGIVCSSEEELSACVHGGRHAIRCADIAPGFACQTQSGTAFCGLADECDPFGEDATCDGTNVVFCNAGRTETVDCTGLGFTGCSEGGRDGAYCSPSPWIGGR